MTEQAFASIWGLSYSDFGFLRPYRAESQVMVAYRVLFFRQHGHFPEDFGALDPDVVAHLSLEDHHGLSPLIYLHINPYGRFEVDLDKRIDFEQLAA